MKKTIALIILLLTTAASAQEAEKIRVRNNSVQFGAVQTGMDIRHVSDMKEAYTTADKVSWIAFESQAPKTRIWAPAPEGISLSEKVISRLSVTLVTSNKTGCSTAPRMLFVSGPGADASLYAYEYVICDTIGLLTPGAMVDQYIAKYGIYDSKDYDLNMVVYNNVLSRYRVGVKPYSADDGKAGVTITVVDNEVFRNTYDRWRDALRKAYESARRLF